jgi:predicted dinucleotide-binding enzyme
MVACNERDGAWVFNRMKVGIIGSGEVAQALAIGFLERGDEVVLGTRDPGKLQEFIAAHSRARATSSAEAATFGDTVVIATLGTATVALLQTLDPAAFANKVIIDVTNAVVADADGFHLPTGFTDSLGERVQRALPQARVVKAFNIVGSDDMVHPKFSGGPPTMFIAGDDAGAKTAVRDILTDFGWEAADIGGITSSRYLEAMCMTWLLYGQSTGKWHHAFKMLT